MQLQEFFDYKNQLMQDLLTNENILRLLDENLALDDAGKYMYKQVFPFEYVPETVEEGKTFICCDVDVQKALSKTFLIPIIYIWVFTHKSTLRLPNGGGVRTDALCSQICQTINGSKMYGLGELDLRSVRRFAPMTDFQGKSMAFEATEIGRFYDPKKRIPSNRKTG